MAEDTDMHRKNVNIAKTTGATVSTVGFVLTCIPFPPVTIAGIVLDVVGGIVISGADLTKVGIETTKSKRVKHMLEKDILQSHKLNTKLSELFILANNTSSPILDDFAKKLIYTYLVLNLNSKADRSLDDFGNLINTSIGKIGRNTFKNVGSLADSGLILGGKAAGKVAGRVISGITLPLTLYDLGASAKRLGDNSTSSAGDRIYSIAVNYWDGFEEIHELLSIININGRANDDATLRGHLKMLMEAARAKRGWKSPSYIKQCKMKRQIKKQPTHEYFKYKKADVYAKIGSSSTFSWAIFKLDKAPFRHVGIVLMFDGQESFSLNIRPIDYSNVGLAKCLTCAAAARSLEDVKLVENQGLQSEPIQTIDISTPDGEYVARSIINIWMDWAGNYSLRDYNCRDDTADCIMSACRIHRHFNMAALQTAINIVNNTREDDRHYYRMGRIFLGRLIDNITDIG